MRCPRRNHDIVLNVVSLFNGTVPLIAIQMQVLKVGDAVTLVFSTVMDELSRGLVNEDEDAEATPTDRGYWEKKATKATVALADDLLALFKEFDPALALNYNKFYIGIYRDGHPFNFVQFRPRRNYLIFELKLKKTEELDQQVEQSGLEAMDYDKRWGTYRLRLAKQDVKDKAEVLQDLAKLAYESRTG